METLIGDPLSGNEYKIRLMFGVLGRPYRHRRVDIMTGVCATPAFRAMNPWGKIPLLITADGEAISESNAILAYLAEGTDWLPAAGVPRARVMELLFWEQYSHEPTLAVLQSWRTVKADRLGPAEEVQIPGKEEGAARALAHMEARLAAAPWLAGGAAPTIADLALYPYTAKAPVGGMSLDPYPQVRAWLDRVRAVPGFVGPQDMPADSADWTP